MLNHMCQILLTSEESSLVYYFGEEYILKRFRLSFCQYVSTIPGNKLHVKVHSQSSGKVAAIPILKPVPTQFSPFIL